MKLHFEADLDHQLQAIDAVCDLFRGQELYRTEFTVLRGPTRARMRSGLSQNDLGIGNRLTLLDEGLLENLNEVQLRSGLPPSMTLESRDFTVEMETGTGKTYVYLRTIFELNRRYGFTKFVIVVPSIAVKEGVYKSLQILTDHLEALYAGVPFEYFLYDSAKLGQVRSFASSGHIQIMVVTVGAINKKDVNNLYKDSEKTFGEKPIDLIRATHPIVIVDEPQSVDGGLQGRGKAALDAMNPLCTLRYSATHVDEHNMVYRLDAVDAYERRLVKQIEVAAATIQDAHNKPYVRLIAVTNRRGSISARVELDVETSSGVQRLKVTVHDGDDLEQTSGRAVYRNCRIGEIRAARGDAVMELRVPDGEHYLRPGQAWGDVDALTVQREMIRRTIQEHLDKEKRLRPQGIKVLSLFFIDEVARYRRYDEDGNPIKGDYARIFEEEYERFARHPDYRTLFRGVDPRRAAEEAHDGYFSVDKRTRRVVDTEESNQAGREAAEQAYHLIMKDKEKLLSFDTPLKFIFSHSALREGWDNPNVFQICTLRDVRSERERRQTVGRGLRLCVNQRGERVRGFDVNTLTVVATESYEQFAANLQNEIEAETGIRFGIVEPHQFAALVVTAPDGTKEPLGVDQSKVLWEALKRQGYIDGQGKVEAALRSALRAGEVKLPGSFQAHAPRILALLRKRAGRIAIKNADERRPVRPRQATGDGSELIGERSEPEATHRVEFDNEKLIDDCIRALRAAPPIAKPRLEWRKADVTMSKGGVQAAVGRGAQVVALSETDMELPDVLTLLQDRTQLTRRTICHILLESGRLDDFKRNPQAFIELAVQAIDRCKRLGPDPPGC